MLIIRPFRNVFNQIQYPRVARRLRPLLNVMLAASLLLSLLPPPLVTTTAPSGEPGSWARAIQNLAKILPAPFVASAAPRLQTAPAFGSEQTAFRNSDGTSLGIAIPGGLTDGDLLLAAIAVDGNVGTVTAPAGWQTVDSGNSSGAVTLAVFYKIVNGDSGTATFTWTGNEEAAGSIRHYTGTDTTNPINVVGSASGLSSTPTAPSVTTTADATTVVRIFGMDRDNGNNVTFSGLSNTFNVRSSTAGNAASYAVGDQTVATAGATGTNSITTGNEEWRAVTVALQEPQSSDMITRVGNRVWYDANDNGVIDGYENSYGIDGVTVELLNSVGTVISTTTTSNGGYYLFTADNSNDPLPDGDYSVRIPASGNMGAAGSALPLADWRSSTDTANASNPNSDINSDDNGPGITSGADVESNTVSLALDTEPTDDGDDANGNLTVDFGFYDVCDVGAGDLGGNIFRDFNSNGLFDANEPGWTDAVTVTAYDNDGNATTTTINPDGSYDFDALFPPIVTDADHIRLEFSGLPSWASSGVAGANSGATVQIHKAASCAADLALQDPFEYCQSNPELVTTCFVAQEHNGGDDDYKDYDALVSFPLDASGEPGDAGYVAPTSLAEHQDIGATFGLAYARDTQTIFAGAYTRRASDYGPSGPGAIYRIDANGNVATHVDLNAIFPATLPGGTDQHNWGTPGDGSNYDRNVRNAVGTTGLGGLTLSGDWQTLYTIGLNSKRLYAIPANGSPTAGNIDEVALPQPAGCPEADTRPFAVGYNDENVYVGIHCSSESAADGLEAYVYEYDGATFSLVLQYDLSFPRNSTNPNSIAEWHTWGINASSAGNEQTMFTDIEFIGQDMVMGFRSRKGDIIYNETPVVYGDIFRACWDGGNWVLEQNGICGGQFGEQVNKGFGPGGGDYYDDDTGLSNIGNGNMGSLLNIHGQNLVASLIDPFSAVSAGVVHLDANGAQTQKYEIYQQPSVDPIPLFGKVNGLGDLDALCDMAPLEIGNYVWHDEDGDGIQDPCEEPIPGVTVTLYDITGTQVASTTTDANGEYYFNDLNVNQNGAVGLLPNTDYEIRIDITQGVLTGYGLTLPDVDSGTTLPDGVDSDGILNGNNAVIALTTGNAGQNDHTFDFGFTEASVRVGNRVWYDANDNAEVDGGESGVDGVLVELLDASGTVTATTVTSGGGLYLFTQNNAGEPLADGDYRVRIPASNFGDDSTPLKGWRSSTDRAFTADPNNDTDRNDNGIGMDSGVDIVSGIVSLEAGTEPDSGVDTDDSDGNLTVDFGFYQAVGTVRINKVTDGEDDIFTFSSDKSNLDGLSISTSGGSGTSGSFTIEAGAYTVTEALLAGWALTDISCTGDDDDGSITDVSNRNVLIDLDEGEDIVCTFSNGEEINELAVEKVLTAPTGNIRLGDTLTYTLRITNTGNVAINELTLGDVYDPDYLTFDGASIAPDAASEGALTWTATASSGTLQDELPLAPGGVITITVNFIATRP